MERPKGQYKLGYKCKFYLFRELQSHANSLKSASTERKAIVTVTTNFETRKQISTDKRRRLLFFSFSFCEGACSEFIAEISGSTNLIIECGYKTWPRGRKKRKVYMFSQGHCRRKSRLPSDGMSEELCKKCNKNGFLKYHIVLLSFMIKFK